MAELVSVDVAVAGTVSSAPVPLMSHNLRARKLRSLVWNDFTKERRADGNWVAICKHCKKQLTASSRSGTTHLRNHLAICMSTKRIKRRKLVVRRIIRQNTSDVKREGQEKEHDGWQFNQEISREDLSRMIVQHGYSMSIVNDSLFRTFVRNLQPQFKMVGYDTVKADCKRICEDAGMRLHEMLAKLPCRVSLSFDTWRSRSGQEFLFLTCYYVEDHLGTGWKLRRNIFDIIHLDSLFMAENVSKQIMEKLQRWGLDKKLACAVLDNCGAGEIIGTELYRHLQEKGLLLSNGNIFQVHSCAHILNLTIQESLDVATELTKRVHASISYVKSSRDRFVKFHKAAKHVGVGQKHLYVDSTNKWISTFSMFESVCHYQMVFSCLSEWDSEYPQFLSAADWTDLKGLTDILDVLYTTMEKLAAVGKPTSNLHFNEICGIHYLLKTWCGSQSHVVEAVASRMLMKFEMYWESTRMVMAFASILDPRYKMKSIEYFFQRIYSEQYEAKPRIEAIQKAIVDLYNEYAIQSGSSSKTQAVLCYVGKNNSSYVGSSYGNGEDPKTFSRMTLSDARRGLDQYIQETSSGQSLKSDLDLYLEEAVHRPKEGGHPSNFDVLGWWRTYAAKYPVLSMMARDILAVPVSVLPLDEEARTLSESLSGMDAVTLQGFVCAQDWLREESEAVSLAVAVSDEGALTACT